MLSTTTARIGRGGKVRGELGEGEELVGGRLQITGVNSGVRGGVELFVASGDEDDGGLYAGGE